MRLPTWLALLLLLAACKQPQKAVLASGTYMGMESMGISSQDITPDDTTDRWYHENTLVVRGDSVFLSKNPVVFYKGQGKAYSSSDGGFYRFRGKVRQFNDSIAAQMLLVSHDYIGIPYFIKNQTAQDSLLSLDELVKQGKAEVDSSFLKRSYQITLFPNHLIMDSVEYRLQ